VGEACGDRTEEIQRANLFDMGAKYTDIVSETGAIEKMKGGWKQVSERENAWTIKPFITNSCDPNQGNH
jgi:hypothetical protein